MEYAYVAYNEEKTVINGSVAAVDELAASERLTKLGYRVLSLKTVRPFDMGLSRVFASSSKVKMDTIVAFSRQLATLISAGVNIVTGLELLQGQTTQKNFKAVLGKVISDVRMGVGLSDAMGRHPAIFSKLYCRSLKVGEQSGDLARVLNQIADYLEKGVTARKSLKSALTYPAIVIVIAVVVIGLLVSFVFPTFIGLYQTMNVQIPTMTRIMMSAVSVVKAAAPYVLGIIIICVIGLMIYLRKPEGKYNWDKFMLKVPLLGHIVLLRELAVICQTMSLLFHTGLPLPEIMDVLIEGSGNGVVARGLADIKKSIFKGEGLSEPMSRNPVFLPMMVEMVKVGEETGEMDTTLLAVSQNYHADADDRTKSFIAVLQPTITIVIGIVVAFIVLSMVTLMYSIYGQIKT